MISNEREGIMGAAAQERRNAGKRKKRIIALEFPGQGLQASWKLGIFLFQVSSWRLDLNRSRDSVWLGGDSEFFFRKK
jgi:hypothetical protein